MFPRAPPDLLESIVLTTDSDGFYIPLTPQEEEQYRVAYNAGHPTTPIAPGPWHECLHQRYENFIIDDVIVPTFKYPDGRPRTDGTLRFAAVRYILQRVPELIDRPSATLQEELRKVTAILNAWDHLCMYAPQSRT